jgi:membrane protease YdiL (CAAX protease family)
MAIRTSAALILFILAYELYWFLSLSPIMRSISHGNTLVQFMLKKSLGFVLFGIAVPAAALILLPVTLPQMGLSWPGSASSGVLTLGASLVLGLLCVAASWLSNRSKARRKVTFGRYPEIESEVWSAQTVVIHVIFWTLYLAGYELMFRGVLQTILIEAAGIRIGIAVTTVIYSAVHIPKGAGEALGALILGILLSILTLSTGSIIAAVIIHCALALPNGLFAVHYREDRSFACSKTR